MSQCSSLEQADTDGLWFERCQEVTLFLLVRVLCIATVLQSEPELGCGRRGSWATKSKEALTQHCANASSKCAAGAPLHLTPGSALAAVHLA